MFKGTYLLYQRYWNLPISVCLSAWQKLLYNAEGDFTVAAIRK